MPTGGQRPCLRFAVAHNATDQQIWIVERCAVGMRNRVSQLAALVNRTGSFRSHMAGNSTRERKLLKQFSQSILVLRNTWIDFAVSPFQISVSNEPGTSMAGSCHIHHVEIMRLDQSIQMHVDEIQSGRSTPMTQKPRLYVLQLQRFAQQ